MTSRSFVWMALGMIAAPLLVQGTGGCQFTPGAYTVTIIDDNAYNCGCACGRPETRSIAASAGDVEQAGSTMTLNGMDLDLGAETVGLRFANAMIPAGADILSASVQFTAAVPSDPTTVPESVTTNLAISAELSTTAAAFTAANDDLSSRTFTAPASDIAWDVPVWNAPGDALDAEKTPDLGPLVQQLVDQAGWADGSAVVLRFAGTGQRSGVSFDGSLAGAAVLTVTWVSAQTSLPVCTTQRIFEQNDDTGTLPADQADADCAGRVQDTLSGLAGECGYPSECRCGLDRKLGTFDRTVCNADCTAVDLTTTPKCDNFDPERFEQCVEDAGQNCAQYVSATNAPGDEPVCTAFEATPAMAARVFGNNSRCEVSGTSQIEVGDREPTKDPMTTGVVEIAGDPCPGGGCNIGAAFALAMDPITFEVRFASDPMFYDLGALGESRSLASLDGVEAVFAEDQVAGTGNGRRGASGLAVNALNQRPLVLGVDWAAGLCDLNGNVASTVDGENPDGTCAGDGTTPCTADSPDCDGPGGPCDFETEDIEDMTVDVSLAGTLVNQPPRAAAGPDVQVECTSAAGASLTLQGTATDPDSNVTLVSWRSGTRIGPEVGRDLALTQSLAVGGAQTYVLKVIDAFMQADEDTVQAGVVDTTAPQLTASVAPIRLTAPNHKMVTINATLASSDVCDTTPTIRLVSITSNEPDNGLGDGDQPNDVQGAAFGTDDRQFQVRNERSGTGRGRTYTITYSATDDTGNATLRQATVTVPR
jgi:hypothetical protein